MTMGYSTLTRKSVKPEKPRNDFPLTAHPNGQWCKKIKGSVYFFGVWADPEAAETRYRFQLDDIINGRQRREPGKPIVQQADRLHYLLNRFYTAKKAKLDAGKLSPYTFQAYIAICEELKAAFGRDRALNDIRPLDFEALRNSWERRWGDERIAAEINRARTVFNFGWKNAILEKPMQYGDGFARPSKKVRRLNKAAKGPKMFEANELRKILDEAKQPLRAMILLGINAALGNSDIAQLKVESLDLRTGWLNYPRPKTGIMRRCPLWPETIAAMQDAIARRPAPTTEGAVDLVFLTIRGDGWGTNIKDRPITHAMRKLLDKLGINGNRNFYSLRHTFKTIGSESIDRGAVNCIMGHAEGEGEDYIEKLPSDDRLRTVVNLVRVWLFPPKRAKSKPRTRTAP